MNKNDSTAVKTSLLLECGLKINKINVEEVCSALFIIAERDLKEELQKKYSIEEILDPQKGPEIFKLYLSYFQPEDNYGAYTIYPNRFLSLQVLRKDFIKKNVSRFKEIFSEFIEEGLSKSEIKKIPNAFYVFLGKESILSMQAGVTFSSNAIHYGQYDPFADICQGHCLRNNMNVRNMLGLWNEVQNSDLVTVEMRIEIYRKVLQGVKQLNYRIKQYPGSAYLVQNQNNQYEALKKLFEYVEKTYFDQFPWEKIEKELQTLDELKEGRKDDC